ncbi:hypothetical protein ACFL38_03390 [Candidatus Omnitrophota bacterium]
MFQQIIKELKHHAPFTAIGAVSGIVIMLLFKRVPPDISHNIFYVLHPAHVLLSALATASMYGIYKCSDAKGKCNIWILLIIGCLGSIGIATLSDSLIPYLGETLLNMPHREAHIGFIERWWLISPLAIIGICIAYFKPHTKSPHAAHVFISTWASLFHIMMARGDCVNCFSYIAIFFFLFVAVWLPCCISDIIFPLLFIKKKAH